MSDCINRDSLIEQFESDGSCFTYGENVVAAIISRIYDKRINGEKVGDNNVTKNRNRM